MRRRPKKTSGRWSLRASILTLLGLGMVPCVYLLLVAILLIVITTGVVSVTVAARYLITEVSTVFAIRLAIPLVGLALFFLFAIVGLIRAIIASFFRPPTFDAAIWLNLNRESALRDFILDICGRLGTKFPTAIVLHVGPQFYVMSGQLTVLNATPRGRILCISLPMLAVLNVRELRAILYHEFAHFTGGDTLYSSLSLPVYQSTEEASGVLYGIWMEGNWLYKIVLAVPLLSGIAVLLLYQWVFHLLNLALSREREFRADFISAQFVGTDAAKGALRKFYAYAAIFDEEFATTLGEVRRQREPIENPYRAYRKKLHTLQPRARAALERELKEQQTLGDTHPTLYNRLGALNSVVRDAHDTDSEQDDVSALTLISNLKTYEEMGGDFMMNEYTIELRESGLL